jgi:hypothetical protein
MRKPNQFEIRLVAGLGVEGDAHSGTTVKHRSRVARNPNAPNLRQVHLIHSELHDELRAKNLAVAPGDMGENVTTRGIDLLSLPTGTRLEWQAHPQGRCDVHRARRRRCAYGRRHSHRAPAAPASRARAGVVAYRLRGTVK